MTDIESPHKTPELAEVELAATRTIQSIRDHFQPVLDQLETWQVTLNSDPVAVGMNQFNQKLSMLRGNVNTASTFLSRAIAMRSDYRVKVNNLERAYEEKLNNLIVLDETISKISGMEAKKRAAQERMVYEGRLVFHAKQILQIITGYHDALKLANDNLKDTKADLMKQLAVVKQQIALGEGGPPPTQGNASQPSRLAQAERELMEEFGDNDARTVSF